MPWRILVVTEDQELAGLAGRLAALGYRATHTTNSWQAVRRVLRDRKNPALIVLDTAAPRAPDFLSARSAIADIATIPVVLLTDPESPIGAPRIPVGGEVEQAPVVARILKPARLDQLISLVEDLCADKAQTTEAGWTPPLGTLVV